MQTGWRDLKDDIDLCSSFVLFQERAISLHWFPSQQVNRTRIDGKDRYMYTLLLALLASHPPPPQQPCRRIKSFSINDNISTTHLGGTTITMQLQSNPQTRPPHGSTLASHLAASFIHNSSSRLPLAHQPIGQSHSRRTRRLIFSIIPSP